jgi:tRNA-modifying protein YgfZ
MPNSPGSAPLNGFELLALEGRDALPFAQAQFCNDVRALAVGQWQWNGWLSPKGRVLALFALLRTGEDALWLVLPDAPATALAERLQAFVFRSKLRLLQPMDWVACGAMDSVRLDPPQQAGGDVREGWQLDFGGDGGARTLHLLPRDRAPATADPALDADWRVFDIVHGLPRLEFDAEHGWTPQMLSLDRLGAYSVKKGCYPGQEIVARTHFLGQAKRGLVRLQATAPLPMHGDVLDAEGRGLGPLVSVAGSAGGSEALAVLPLATTDTTMQVEGTRVEPRPMLDGLRR